MLLTRCPECDTTFRVTDETLKKASGQVRCGRCASVFNAYAERTIGRQARGSRAPPKSRGASPRLDPPNPPRRPPPRPKPGRRRDAANPQAISATRDRVLATPLTSRSRAAYSWTRGGEQRPRSRWWSAARSRCSCSAPGSITSLTAGRRRSAPSRPQAARRELQTWTSIRDHRPGRDSGAQLAQARQPRSPRFRIAARASRIRPCSCLKDRWEQDRQPYVRSGGISSARYTARTTDVARRNGALERS
jgi:predicted Zn finger-like uncharacterized protein